MKKLLFIAALCIGLSCLAEVKVVLDDNNNKFQVMWNGNEVVLPSKPALRNIGGGKRQFFDPVARVFREVEVPASQGVFFNASNKQGEPVFLGEGTLTAKKDGDCVIYRQAFASAGAWWQMRFQPVEDNGLDILLEAEVAPEFWLTGFDAKIMDLNLDKGAADYGGLGQWRRNLPTSKGLLLGPVPGDIRINFPGNNNFVPAAVLQDDKYAMGICRLGVHDVWRAQFGELSILPKDKRYELRASTGWAEAISTSSLYQNRIQYKYRLRFSEKRNPGPTGYLQLVDAKDLWIDYMREMDKYVPIQPNPAYDRQKNNILIMNFFMAENYYINDKNPQGWVMNDPQWKTNKWEFPPKAENATGEELRKLTGFTEDNFGRPVKWIRAYAEKNLQELKETKAMANVVWRSATWRGANNLSLDYLPDTHYFHPEMEELMAVDGPVCNWDWIVADIELLSPDGKPIVKKNDVEIHAADRGKLRKLARYEDLRQRLAFKVEDLQEAAAEYVKSAADIGSEEKYRDLIRFYVKVLDPKDRLIGKKAGDKVDLEAIPLVGNPDLSSKKLTIRAQIKGVKRSAIDVWAKTLTDADCEIGFLIREDFLLGPPWHQTFMRLDWTAEWQYDLFRQRVEWHQARFGKKCRWFYLDVFANETPDFIMQRIRRDFPDCFFFVEHPNGVALRTLQSWNWFNTYTDLELYLNPNAMAIILPERILSSGYGAFGSGQDKAKDQEFMRKAWRNPNYIFATHRGARALMKYAEEQQVK